MLQKIGLIFMILMGIALVFWGNEHLDRAANVSGHVLILLGLILGIRMSKSQKDDKSESEVQEEGTPAIETKPVSCRVSKDRLQRLPK